MSNEKNYAKLARSIRAHAVLMTNLQRSGHLGSTLSMADLLAVLYESILVHDPNRPELPERDRFILSKGHASAGVYAALALKGFFPLDWLKTYYCDDGKLCGHISHHVPGVEFSTGSLGHGLPVAAGMALASRTAANPFRVLTLLSDGDCNEGSTWEAVMFAAQHKLDNLTVIVDYNRIQALGESCGIIDLEPLSDKFSCFGWAAEEIDGHNFDEIFAACSQLPFEPGKPSCIIARTVKGKGLKHMEHTVSCHYNSIPDEDIEKSLNELGVGHEDGF